MLTVNAVEVQKHRLKGPVGYTVVGNPTIVDGVVSGFAGGSNLQGNYLKAQSFPNFTGDVEIVIKFKADAWAYGVLSSWIISGYSCFISIDGNGKPACYFSRTGDDSTNLSIDTSSHSFAFTAGQDCYINVRKTAAGTLTMYSSSDGKTYTQFATKTNTNYGTSTVSSYFRIGVNAQYNPGNAFPGSIDLNQTYIKVNGKLWFYQPADTKYIVKDGKLVWADPRLALSGPVGYEVVGNPTIVDGVASGFSGSNFINLAIPFNPDNNTWECVFKVTTGSDVSTESFLFRSAISAPAAAGRFGLNFKLHNRQFKMEVSYNGTAWDVSVTGTHTVLANTIYWLKYKWDGSAYTMDYSLDGINFIRDISYESNTGMYNNLGISQIGIYSFQPSYSSPFLGSIDLKETYIKVNNQLWFYGKNYATQNIAPVPAGYTFGTTTTPSIGYVDMRTQQFTAAPSGATIGRDE